MKYFDYAATTPMLDSVLTTYVQVSEKYFAGIDVGAQELVLVLRNNAKSQPAQTFANTFPKLVRIR